MPLFSFTYGMDDVCYDPCSPHFTIEAESLEVATIEARARFDEFLFNETREKWCEESRGGKDWEWYHYPATDRTGWLSEGREVGKPRPFNSDAFTMPKPSAEAAEALAAVLSQPLLDVIEQAPIFTAAFEKALLGEPDTGFSIPLSIHGTTVYSPPPGWVPNHPT